MNNAKIVKNCIVGISIAAAITSVFISGLLGTIILTAAFILLASSSFITWDNETARYSVLWSLDAVERKYGGKDAND